MSAHTQTHTHPHTYVHAHTHPPFPNAIQLIRAGEEFVSTFKNKESTCQTSYFLFYKSIWYPLHFKSLYSTVDSTVVIN